MMCGSYYTLVVCIFIHDASPSSLCFKLVLFRRALNHVKALFDKRVPAAEEAAAALDDAARTLFDARTGLGEWASW